MIDEVLTEAGVILPGMGDCGNRLYATEEAFEHEDESLVLPAKRKKSADFS